MTCVFGLLDPNIERRELTLRLVKARLADAPDDTTDVWARGALTILAQHGSTAPLDQAEDAGRWAWVLGHINESSTVSSAAQVLTAAAGRDGAIGINGLNGYYLACLLEADGAVTLGVDALGFFPLYVWANAEVLIFSSQPGLLRLHPNCAGHLSLEGLAGILLQGHIANGQTLWQGIVRPDAGHAVRWTPSHGARSHAVNPLTPNDRYFGNSYESARNLFNATLHDAVSRSIARESGPLGMMLSGGLDSRLVAGHLQAVAPGRASAFIFGDKRDIEVRCARDVAHHQSMPQVLIPIQFAAFTSLAERGVNDEHLCNTLQDFGWLSGMPTVRKYGLRMVSGFIGDPIMGGSLIPWAFDPQRGAYSFDTMFARLNRGGFSPAEIVALLPHPPMASIVNSVITEMRARYEALPGLPFQKSWLWGLQNRLRYHVAPYVWRLSSAAWPLMPFYDSAMLNVAAGMPLDFIGERRMQIDTLKKNFPALARLPLDRNSYDSTPLLPTRFYRLKTQVLAKLRPHSQHAERRAYYRVFDINNAGWRTIRERAESQRAALCKLVDANVLAAYLPPPDSAIAARDGIIDTARHKILLGLMLLAEQAPALTENDTGRTT